MKEGEEEVEGGELREGHTRVLGVENTLSVRVWREAGANGQRIGGSNGRVVEVLCRRGRVLFGLGHDSPRSLAPTCQRSLEVQRQSTRARTRNSPLA